MSKRSTTSRSVVGATCRVRLEGENVADLSLVFCGVSKVVKRAEKTETALIGGKWDASIIEKAFENLAADLFADIEQIGKNVEYRKSLVQAIFFKFLHSSSAAAKGAQDIFAESEYPVVPRGTQTWEEGTDKNNTVVGKSYHHTSGAIHGTGEAKYVGDIETPVGTLHSAVVVSNIPHGNIKKIDASEALKCEGVVAFFSGNDFASNPASPLTGMQLLPTIKVDYCGQPIGLVVADTHENALRATYKVKVEYEELPALVDFDSAIKAESLFPRPPFPMVESLDNGKVEDAFADTQNNEIFEGQYELGGAKHYYMETHTSLVIPQERDELLIHCTSQDLKTEQDNASAATGIPRNKISIRVKRVGGAFGGKGGGGVYAAVAVAASKLKKPVKIQVPRSIDSIAFSRRGIYRAKFKAAVSKKDHKVVAVDWDVMTDGGCGGFGMFLTNEVLLHLDNCYNFPNFRCNGRTFKTNRTMTMAMRGAGIPQGTSFCEMMLEDIALKLGIDSTKFKESHLMQTGQKNIGHQTIEDAKALHQAWKELTEDTKLAERVEAVKLFNAENKFKKRGISLSPVRYSIRPAAFAFFAQAHALVHCHSDGTVLLSCDGIELGQGIYVKMAQICAETLGIPIEDVHIPHFSSEQTANAIGMGGSVGTELKGGAVKKACEELKQKMDLFKKMMNAPQASFKELCAKAFFARVTLSAYAHYTIDVPKELQENHGFGYFTWGGCLSEVEIDVLTGQSRILECFTIQDLGRSVNPAIDIGQIEGGFMMGLSWLTQEELIHDSKNGKLLTTPEEYEIAGPQNLPEKFHVKILPGVDNPNAVYSAKGVGEPPHSMPISVVCALKQAIAAARKDLNLPPCTETFVTPVTRERIQLLCGNHIQLSKKKSNDDE